MSAMRACIVIYLGLQCVIVWFVCSKIPFVYTLAEKEWNQVLVLKMFASSLMIDLLKKLDESLRDFPLS